MSFWRSKEKNLIPPVEDDHSNGSAGEYSTQRPYPASHSTSSIPSRYASTGTAGAGAPSRYKDAYARGERNIDHDRSELFAGYDVEKSGGQNRFRDNGPSRSYEELDEDDDEEVIKTKTRFTKQESVNTSRNALRIAREAEETGKNTLLRLGDQSGQL